MRKIDYDLAWGSHLPMLMKVMSLTKGNVLELGAGLYSTPFLYWLCKDQERVFRSYENDFDWWQLVWNLKGIENNTTWKSVDFDRLTRAGYVADWNDANVSGNWDVVLIDHSPSRRRIEDIKKFVDTAKFVVVHDTQRNYKFCDYRQIYPLFKYRFDYTKSGPHTTVLSNFVNLQEVLK